ncbi:sensor histidine kinase [Sediminibacterium ginsengisoli]|uniref:histidine kinase n=1 Tax=Sediminibacterium ginsengisoli TaxID=413434 RepID=A0A1T4P7Z0_9BACT|nr:ATP-binding protein [Sediminibacterium ginsengisoli]SJZ87663.1 hypothetical protein SAMN04488132_105203 [Sediminibacterium ginsengisoli]
MQELTQISLENEMDLILAHRRSMRLAELVGLSVPAQTTFATAVSELSRGVIEDNAKGMIVLGVTSDKQGHYAVVRLHHRPSGKQFRNNGLDQARKLVSNVVVSTKDAEAVIELFYYFQPVSRIDVRRIDEWRGLFRNEPPMSAYEELKGNHEKLRDLSERLQRSESQYQTLAGTLPMIIFSLDSGGKFSYANQWLETLTGMTTEQLNNNGWASVVHEEDLADFRNLISGGAGTVTDRKIQVRLGKYKSNDYFWHQVSLTPVYNERQELQHWIGYMVDIHNQKVYEETLRKNIELRESHEAMERTQQIMEEYIDRLSISNQELQQFAYVASHDLQEPTRKILFYTDKVLSRHAHTLNAEVASYVGNIQSASYRMRDLIHDLLLYAQLNSTPSAFEELALTDIMHEAVGDLEAAIQTSGARISVSALPVIRGDKNMLRRLLINIISNAIKYAKPEVAPQIDITAFTGNGMVSLSFKDNGIGFEQQYADKIFLLFQRLHSRDLYSGTGVGLAICKRIAEAHGGTISAVSEPDLGSVFTVTFAQTIAADE